MNYVNRKARAWVSVVSMVVLALSAAAGAAYAEPVRNIVLVHGAFADGSSWARLIPLLQAKGYNVTATKRALALQNGLNSGAAGTR